MTSARRLTVVLAGVMAAQAASGLLWPDVYRDEDALIKSTWFGIDWITLLAGTPLLLVGSVRAARGSVRGLLLWIGAIGRAGRARADRRARNAFAGRPTPIHPEAFKIVAALDLSLMVRALTSGGILWWRRHPWGYVLAPLASIQGALYLVVLSVSSLVAIRRGLAAGPGELAIWGPLTAITATLALVLLTNVRPRVT